MLLNIVVPSIHKADKIIRLVDSILFHVNRVNDIHIIIVDDCSQYFEDKVKVVNEYKDKVCIDIIQTAENSGPGVARQLGKDFSTSEYIYFLDDDDIILSDPLALCDKYYGADIISTDYYHIKGCKCEAESVINSLNPILYKASYLDRIGVKFMPIINGMEDSIYRAITFICTKNIAYDHETIMYEHMIEPDSVFTVRNSHYTKGVVAKADEHNQWACLFINSYFDIFNQHLNELNLMALESLFTTLLTWFGELCEDTEATPPIIINSWYCYLVYFYKLLPPLIVTELLKDDATYFHENPHLRDLLKTICCIIYYGIIVEGDYLFINPKIISKCKSIALNVALSDTTDVFAVNYKALMDTVLNYNYLYFVYTNENLPKTRAQINKKLQKIIKAPKSGE